MYDVTVEYCGSLLVDVIIHKHDTLGCARAFGLPGEMRPHQGISLLEEREGYLFLEIWDGKRFAIPLSGMRDSRAINKEVFYFN